MLFQWGKTSTSNEQITLAISYIHDYVIVDASLSSNYNNSSAIHTITASGFKINTTGANWGAHWLTVGY